MNILSCETLSIDGIDFKLRFYSYYEDCFRENRSVFIDKFKRTISYLNFHQQKLLQGHTLIKNVDFNLFVDLENKKLFVTSLRASQEYFLASIYEDDEISEFISDLKIISQSSNFSWINYSTWNGKLKNKDEFYNDEIFSSEQALKKRLISYLDLYKAPFMEKVSNFSLDLSSQYDLIRIHILKFLAVVPCLDHDSSGTLVKSSLLEMISNLLRDQRKIKKKIYKNSKPLPLYFTILIRVIRYISWLTPAFILTPLIKSSIRFMAKRFIAGSNISEAKSVLKQLKKTNRDATFDQLGELVVTPKEADHYLEKVLETINGFDSIYPKGEKNAADILKAHVSVKVSALAHNLVPYDFDYSFNQIEPRLKKILLLAKEKEVFVNIDAEHYEYRDVIWNIYKKILAGGDFKDWNQTGIVVQAYLKDAYQHLQEIIDFCELRDTSMPIRLVKGAYWDAETIEADAHAHIAPQYLNKKETDIHFRQLIFKILESDHLVLSIASHNIHDHCYSESIRGALFPNNKIEHQCLHMTYEGLSFALSKMGWATRNYVPIGDLLIGMSYLVRRIMENSSQTGFLFHSRKDNISLLDFDSKRYFSSKSKMNGIEKNLTVDATFFNYPGIQLFKHDQLSCFQEHHLAYQERMPLFFSKGEKIYSPANDDCVGEITFSSSEEVNNIVDVSRQAYLKSDWSENWKKRVQILINAVEYMRISRDQLVSLIMIESGKTIEEAFADLDEAIDFINFYVRTYVDSKLYNYDSKGIGLIIAPWNFPLAIACGMSVASLVTGNSTILKSSEKTPLVAEVFKKILSKAGIESGVFQHVPGFGHEIGQALSEHEDISFITFTGSKRVGEMLYEKSSEYYTHLKSNQKIARKIIAEMGGKNAIVVTGSCELDETISGVLYSSFAHAGQKCSACSRVFVHKSVANIFSNRLKEAVEALTCGSNLDLATKVNPLISKNDKIRLSEIKNDLKNILNKNEILVDQENNHSYLVNPFVFMTDLKKSEKNKIFKEEFFGPILHIITYDNDSELIKSLNQTDYALTFGIFSQSYDEIEKITSKVQAGNIYVNRSCTGARVAIEPFGGFKLSGTGPKAGGASYLNSFVYKLDIEKDSFHETGSDYLITDFKDQEIDLEKKWEELQNFPITQNISDLYTHLKSEKLNSNRVIPGQVNYNDYQLNQGTIVVLTSYETPSENIIELIKASYLLNQKVMLLTTNEKSYSMFMAKYKNLCAEILFSSPKVMKKVFSDQGFHTFFLEGDFKTKKEWREMIPSRKQNYLVKVYDSNLNLVVDPLDYFELLYHRRAFAVNTMRHGAPLELS